jgi:hypothetical protein
MFQHRYYRKEKPEAKIDASSIECLFEHTWLKFRDKKPVGFNDPSPTNELMALAREQGIRPQTSSNASGNLFFIHETLVEKFLQALQKSHPEFTAHVKTIYAKDKANQQMTKQPLPQW